MARKKKAGRPKGSKNNSSSMMMIDESNEPKRGRGRPPGIKAKRKPGRPAGKRMGRPPGIKKNNLIGASGHSVNGIHFIGNTLIVDTNQMSIDEVIFLGEGKTPKVR